MKHENNFLLYSIGSAFLLVAGAMLLSVPENPERLVAQVSTTTLVDERSFQIPTAHISGKIYVDSNKSYIYDGSDTAVSGIVVVLTKQGEDILDVQQFSKTISDEQGVYSFDEIPLGEYVLGIQEQDGFSIAAPSPRITGFSNPRSTVPISLVGDDTYYTGMDFALVQEENIDEE